MPHRDPEARQTYRHLHRHKINARKRAVYAQNKADINAGRRWRYQVDLEFHDAIKARDVIKRAEMREMIFKVYGESCQCCREARREFLTLDHYDPKHKGVTRKRGDGFTSSVRGYEEYARLRRLGWPKDGVRILCMNCNWATKRGGPCPHESEGKQYGPR